MSDIGGPQFRRMPNIRGTKCLEPGISVNGKAMVCLAQAVISEMIL